MHGLHGKIVIAALAVSMAGPAFAADVADGEKVFKKCAACHMVGDDAKIKVGPVLNGVFGRTAGTDADYASKYSKDMIKAGEDGLVWTPEKMMAYLEKPKAMIPKTKMSFAGLKSDEDISAVIAYLRSIGG